MLAQALKISIASDEPSIPHLWDAQLVATAELRSDTSARIFWERHRVDVLDA